MLSSYANVAMSDVTRLQVRQSNLAETAWTQSTFITFLDRFYFLDQFDRQYNTAYSSWHFDINLGENLPVSWAARSQKYQGVGNVTSLGLQINFLNNDSLQSFIQVFPIKTSDLLGRTDLLHYYSIPLDDKLSLRGYNQYIVRNQQSNLFYPWADLIYAVNKHFDVYTRLVYLSSDDTILGSQGAQYWLGFRFNI